jgi:hypothetical protein
MRKFWSVKAVSLSTVVALFVLFTGCQKVNDVVEKIKGEKNEKNDIPGIIFYALHGSKLDKFSTSNPEKVMSSMVITGMQDGEMIVGIDFRPATGQLYGLGSRSRLYVINPSSGAATFAAALTTIPAGSTTSVPLALSGTSFGFDFNPAVDRIRIVSNTGQNLRAHPTTGVTIVDGSINPASVSVNGAAYDNNDTDSTTTTELFALDPANDRLYEIDPPNNGTLIDPLPININITGDGGFDIAPRNASVTMDIGLALYEVNKVSTLFKIDVETGETKVLGYYKGARYTALAISPLR